MKTSSNTREFSSRRLYRLIKRLVIGITILTVLYFGLALYVYNFELNQMYKLNLGYCGGFPQPGAGDLAWKYYGECADKADAIIDFWTNSVIFSPIIAIILPSIFFGGLGIYRYLFPRNKAE